MCFNKKESYFVIDSMPLKICENARAMRSKICRDEDFSYPDYGFCASQKLHYFGYKLHIICSIEGVVQSLDMTPASVHDVHYLKDVSSQIQNWLIHIILMLCMPKQINTMVSCLQSTDQKRFQRSITTAMYKPWNM